MNRTNLLPWPLPLAFSIALLIFAGAESAFAQGTIKVFISTDSFTGPQPGVRVNIGPYATTTNTAGKGELMIPPGEYASSAACSVVRVVTPPNVSSVGGSAQQPVLSFKAGGLGSTSVTFLCGSQPAGTVRVKIATRTSCNDDPTGEVKLQGGVEVQIGQNTYTSNDKGVIEADVPVGSYPIFASWKDSTFGYASRNGLKLQKNESGLTTLNLSDATETIEIRMFTCGEDGREKARAVITEIGVTGTSNPASVSVTRSNARGNGFVGMYLRDGDHVRISGTAKLKWLDPAGTVGFDDPRGSASFVIGPNQSTPVGVSPKPQPGFIDFLSATAVKFLLPPPKDPYENEVIRDEKGIPIRIIIKSPNARISIKGTEFRFGYDETRQTTSVRVTEGVVNIEPSYLDKSPFYLRAGESAEISPSGVSAPGAQASANGPAVRPVKAVFGPNERIDVEYSNPKAMGWDWVVIVQPSKLPLASGPHSSVGPAYALQFEPSNNSPRDLRSTNSFPPLPEGEYEVHYISWDGGNNLPKASAPFTVGNSSQPPQPPVVTPPPNITPAALRWNLTGLWRNPGGEGVYRVRQIEAKVIWGLDATSLGSVANMFQGQMSGDHVDGVWEDLPGSPTIGGGRMLLKVESECRFVRVSSVNRYGADVWVKKDSPCDRQAGGGSGTPVTALGPLSGLWRNPGGDAIYRFRHVGSKLHWGVDAVPIRSFANTFQGDVNGSSIDGSWVDLPGSPAISGGKLSLKIESECRIVKTGEAGHYAAQVWVRKDSLCDVVGLPQKTAQTPTTTKPKVEEIPTDGEIAVAKITQPPATTRPKPKVEEIPPDGEITVAKNNDDNKVFINEATTKEERTPPSRQQPPPKPKPTPAPKKEGPGFWERLGTAINTTVTQQQQQQQQPTGGTTQPQRQPDGSCRGGSYWLGTPTTAKTSGFQIPWSSPIGADRHHFRVYRAGTNHFVGDNDQPQNANACGLSWHFYLPAGQYDIYLFPSTMAATRNVNTNPVAGPIRITVTQ